MDEQDLARDLLHFGACVTLSVSEDEFMVSQGFADEALSLHDFSSDRTTDFVSAVFRILPSAMYAMQGELLGQVQRAHAGTTHFGQDRLLALEENLEGELKTNIQTYENFKGRPVKFNEVVQFEHISSHKYITIHGHENAERERDNLKLSLQDFGSEYSQFKIEACYNFQREGDGSIRYGDKVKLAVMVPEMNKSAYIHCSTSEPKSSPFDRLRGFLAKGQEAFKDSAKAEDREINGSLDESTNWRVSQFTPYMKEDSDYVLVGDHVWLAQSELRACLTATKNPDDSVTIALTKNIYDSNGLWKIESVNYKVGGTVALGLGFRLRHISTGWYLAGSNLGKAPPLKHISSAIARTVRSKEVSGKLTLRQNPEPSTVWKFISINSRNKSKLLLRDEYFKIGHVSSRSFLNNVDMGEEVIPTLSNKESQSGIFKISRSDYSLVWEALFLINSLPVLQGFPRLIAVQQAEVSASEALARNREFKHDMSLLRKCLRDLDLFCRNQLKSMMSLNHRYGQVESSRQNILREQNFLEALGNMLEAAFTGPYELKRSSRMLLDILKERDQHQLQAASTQDVKVNLLSILVEGDQQARLQEDIEKKQLKELADIIEQTYDLLTVMCKDNQANKKYVFRMFPIIQQHAPFLRNATTCMQEIVKDNEEILIKINQTENPKFRMSLDPVPSEKKESVIQYFAYLLRRFSDERKGELLAFLRTICSHRGQGFSVNQEKVHEQLFNNPETHSKTIITTMAMEDNQRLLVFFKGSEGEQSVPLDDCFDNGVAIGFVRQLEYFKEMLDLFAAMCGSRNYICSESITKWFPIKTLQYNMWNARISLGLRASFCRLMLALYVDAFPRGYSKKPELCRILQSQDEEEKYHKREVAQNHSLTSESGQEVRQTALNFTTALLRAKTRPKDTAPTTIRSLVPGLVLQSSGKTENDMELSFQPENAILFELKSALLDHFVAVWLEPEFDEFSYNLVKMAHEMCKFGLFGVEYTNFQERKCIVSPKHAGYSPKNMDLARLLRALQSSLTLGSNLIDTKKSSKTLLGTANAHKKERSDSTYTSIIAKVMKDPSSLADPVVRGSVNLKNYIESVLHKPQVENFDGSYELQTKIEVCELFHYAADCRLDFLLRNVVEWFVGYENPYISEDESLQLLPPIEAVAGIDKKENAHVFKCVLEPVIENLDDMLEAGGKLLVDLVRTFTFSQNYKLQTLLISLIIRCFSQRRDMLAGLRDLHILTQDEDIEIYKWTKMNLTTLTHYAEQSEIWLKFWTQTDPAVKDRDEGKLRKVTSILEHFDSMLTLKVGLTQQNILDRQDMLYYLDTHHLLISLIRDGMFTLAELAAMLQTAEVAHAVTKMSELFALCHRVLKRMVEGNPRNQRCLQEHLHIFTSHLSLDVEQIQLICEIYRDNWELCIALKQETLQQFIALIVHHGRQPRFLEFFEVVQVIRGKPITENQRKVLYLFLATEETKKYLLYLTQEGEHDFTFVQGHPHEQALSPYEDQPFHYHAKLFRVLMLCGFGTNRVYLNEAKCQKAIPLDSVFTLLEHSEDESRPDHQLWGMLVQPLLEFFFHIYLETEKRNEELVGNPKFVQMLKNHERRLYLTDHITPQNLQHFCIFMKILNHYTNSYVKSTDDTLMADQEDLVALRSFATSFQENMHKFQDCAIDRETLDAMQNFMGTFEVAGDVFSIFSVTEEPADGVESEKKVSSLEMYADSKRKWEEFRKDLLMSKKAKAACKEELKSLVFALTQCQVLDANLSFQLLAKTIITYLHNSVAESAPVPTVLDLISVFNYIIKSDRSTLKERQEELNKFGATRVVLALMSERDLDVEVYKALLHTASKLLYGGNEVIQMEFYMFFINTPTSELLFERLHSLLSQQADLLLGENLGQEKIDSDQVRVSLRLLQLFCENHNLNLQKYLSQQSNSRNSYDLVTATVKLLSALMKKMLFDTFHVMSQCFDTLTEAVQGPCVTNQDIILDGLFLETATALLSFDESAAVPTKYLSLVTEGAGFTDHGTSREYMTGWMIAHLKYKCLITVHSLMEGRTDPSIITRVRVIHLEILWENLISFYSGYEREYGIGSYNSSMFGKTEKNEAYDLSAYNNPQDKHPEHFLVIIENAFFIYHLMRKFEDIDDPENKDNIKEELAGLGMEDGESNLIPLKLIGDLGKIGLGLVKQGVKSLTKVASLVLSDASKDEQFEQQKLAKLLEAKSFLQTHTGHIEIIFNGALCKVYFPLPFYADCLTTEMIEGFHSKADRSSDKTKLRSLVQQSAEINEEMRHEYRLRKFINTSKVMKLIARNLSTWKDLSFLLTLVLNFLILASFSAYGTDRLSDYSLFYYESRGSGRGLTASGTKGLFIALGLSQTVVTSFIVVFFLIKVGPLLFSRGWRSKTYDLTVRSCVRKVIFTQTYYYIRKTAAAFVYLLREVDVLFYLFYLVFSILGTFVTPLFFSFHLLDVLYRYPSLQNVIKSITLPKEALLVSFLFMLIIIYFFSIVGYAYFYDSFNPGECESLWACACGVFDHGFKADGGIGGYMEDWPTGTIEVGRLFYDNAYNILIIIIMMNIVQSLTVDTFAVLRKQHERDKADRENKCYICGLEKESIERATNRSFRIHTLYEHNEWRYVQFMGYLEDKEETEYTGIESYISMKIENKDDSWFPQHEALSITSQESSSDAVMLKQSEELKATLQYVETDLKELNKSLDAGIFSQAT